MEDVGWLSHGSTAEQKCRHPLDVCELTHENGVSHQVLRREMSASRTQRLVSSDFVKAVAYDHARPRTTKQRSRNSRAETADLRWLLRVRKDALPMTRCRTCINPPMPGLSARMALTPTSLSIPGRGMRGKPSAGRRRAPPPAAGRSAEARTPDTRGRLARSLTRREDWPSDAVGVRRTGGDLLPCPDQLALQPSPSYGHRQSRSPQCCWHLLGPLLMNPTSCLEDKGLTAILGVPGHPPCMFRNDAK